MTKYSRFPGKNPFVDIIAASKVIEENVKKIFFFHFLKMMDFKKILQKPQKYLKRFFKTFRTTKYSRFPRKNPFVVIIAASKVIEENV